MAIKELWAIGVDLGGTKVEMAQVDEEGNLDQRIMGRNQQRDKMLHRPTLTH
jgi:predicted NBD/HSP70 family sugar kinase